MEQGECIQISLNTIESVKYMLCAIFKCLLAYHNAWHSVQLLITLAFFACKIKKGDRGERGTSADVIGPGLVQPFYSFRGGRKSHLLTQNF